MKFAVVGCGHIARKHAEALTEMNGAVLAAACDTNRIQAEQFGSLYGARVYTEYAAMLENPEIDAVCICTPSGLHATLAMQAAQAGKHVVVEKPMALTLEDADRMIRECEIHNVKLSVVHPNRFRPAAVALKQAVDKGRFGKLSHINATVRWNRNQDYYDQAAWRGTKSMDGGVLMNQAIHNLDLVLWLMGPVEHVEAYTSTRLRNIECEDVAVALLEFRNGAIGLVEAATTIYPKNYEESISLFGETGSAVIGGPTANWIKHWVFENMDDEEAERLIREVHANPFGISGHRLILEDMANAVAHDRSPLITGHDGRSALKLVLDIYEAAEKHKMATVPDSVNAG